jgi:hypothetical protein
MMSIIMESIIMSLMTMSIITGIPMSTAKGGTTIITEAMPISLR